MSADRHDANPIKVDVCVIGAGSGGLSVAAGAVQMILFTGAAFWLFIPKLGAYRAVSIDTDWFYRRPARLFRRALVDWVDDAFEWCDGVMKGLAARAATLARNPLAPLRISKSERYSPDDHRLSLETAILLVLVLFITLAAWVVFSSS